MADDEPCSGGDITFGLRQVAPLTHGDYKLGLRGAAVLVVVVAIKMLIWDQISLCRFDLNLNGRRR